MKQRYFIELSFNGSAYHGWQIQPNAPSVQQTVEEAVSALIKEKVRLTGAGRTDTGVHASYFTAHFDTPAGLINPLDETLRKLNHMLPHDISISSIFPVRENYHSRFSALSRTYRYYISRRKNPFARETSFHYYYPLELKTMNEAAGILKGYNDFRSFCRSNSGTKTYNCRIQHAEWTEEEGMLVFEITADRFLRNMVRAIVGTMLKVGHGKISTGRFSEIIEAGNRSLAGPSAPAHGLFLEQIKYPQELFEFRLINIKAKSGGTAG